MGAPGSRPIRLGPNTRTCIDDPPAGDEPTREGRTVHAWQTTGLHIVRGKLCTTRRCSWCQVQQAKPYGGKRGWSVYDD